MLAVAAQDPQVPQVAEIAEKSTGKRKGPVTPKCLKERWPIYGLNQRKLLRNPISLHFAGASRVIEQRRCPQI